MGTVFSLLKEEEGAQDRSTFLMSPFSGSIILTTFTYEDERRLPLPQPLNTSDMRIEGEPKRVKNALTLQIKEAMKHL